MWRWMAAFLVVSCVGGCASSKAMAPDAEGPGRQKFEAADGDKAKKDGPDREPAKMPADDAAKAPEEPADAPDRRAFTPTNPAVAGAANPREAVDELSRELEGQIGSYREDFGVESGSAEYGRDVVVTCEDICDVKAAICASSGKICRISTAYPDDDHTRGRCSWAQDECSKAEEACTRCR